MEAWKAGFAAQGADFTVSYDATGSGAGINQFLDRQVAWVGSDNPLEGEEIGAAAQRCGSPAWALPVYISPLVVFFNVPGVESLRLDGPTVAKIFRGQITNWRDPAVQATNPGVVLPDLPITPVHRSDKSGTTENFTAYLHAVDPQTWPEEAAKTWPLPGGESGDKTAGLVQAVAAGQGLIGYADASQVGDLGVVQLAVEDGSYVQLTDETATRAVEAAGRLPGREDNDMALALDRTPVTAGTYPLVVVSYAIACSRYPNPAEAAQVRAFLHYQTSAAGQQLAADNAGSVPLSPALRRQVQAAIEQIH